MQELLTSKEAIKLLEQGQRDRRIMAAYSDHNHPAHALVQELARGLYYLAYEHPQDSLGRPLPLEALGYRPLTPAQERRLAIEADIKWTRFEAGVVGAQHPLNDANHPDHEKAHAELADLYRQAGTAEAAPPARATTPVMQARERLAALRQEIAGDPGHPYLNRQDAAHEQAVEMVTQAYADAYPSSNTADAAPAAGGTAAT